MLVVADSSPLNVLIRIEYVDVLPVLFTQVVIPSEVARELSRPRTPQIVKDFIARTPPWLAIREARPTAISSRLDPGELAAISLALELKADFLLIDEKAGRRAAAENNLTIIGSIGILERAAERGLLDLNEAFQRVRRTDFHVSNELLDQSMERHNRNTSA